MAQEPVITKASLNQLRRLVLVDGLTVPNPLDGQCPYRCYLWAVFLQAGDLQPDKYFSLVRRGPSPAYTKIRNDTFRTLTTDRLFHSKVGENSLIRVLNCLSWLMADPESENRERDRERDRTRDRDRDRTGRLTVTDRFDSREKVRIYVHNGYVQGMNVIAAPFLYVCRGEPQAFNLLFQFLTKHCPTYITPDIQGAHTGVMLFDICFRIIDPELYNFLNSKFMAPELYALAPILTFSACTPPLPELLALWDAMFACGCHMNVLFLLAQTCLMRGELLTNENTSGLLRSFPPLQADSIIKLSLHYITKLPDEVYNMLAMHTYDPTIKQKAKKYLERMTSA